MVLDPCRPESCPESHVLTTEPALEGVYRRFLGVKTSTSIINLTGGYSIEYLVCFAALHLTRVAGDLAGLPTEAARLAAVTVIAVPTPSAALDHAVPTARIGWMERFQFLG